MQAVIMAGGKGTRLSEITKDIIPKPMVQLCGKPLIEYAILCLKESGIRDIIVVTGHLGHFIEEYLQDGKAWGVSIRYVKEEKPLGTAGAFFYLKELVNEDFVLLYADIMMNIDFIRMYHFFCHKNALAVLLVHPNSHPYDSDLVLVDSDARILGFDYKGKERNYDYDNIVNAGAFILSPEILQRVQKPEKIDFEKELLADMLEKTEAIYAYFSTEYIRDVGTPERLRAVEEDYRNGIISNRKLVKKQQCIFLDRDGTINIYKGLITNKEKIDLLPNAAEAVRSINRSHYLAIVITNQPVLARGMCSEEELAEIHKRLKTLLGKEGAYLDDIYYCPHHPDKGYPEEVLELKIKCNCRKPSTGLIDKCIQKYNIDVSKSWMIGDTFRDMKTGNNAGLKTVLVQTGEVEKRNDFDATVDYRCADLLEAVRLILGMRENNGL